MGCRFICQHLDLRQVVSGYMFTGSRRQNKNKICLRPVVCHSERNVWHPWSGIDKLVCRSATAAYHGAMTCLGLYLPVILALVYVERANLGEQGLVLLQAKLETALARSSMKYGQ